MNERERKVLERMVRAGEALALAARLRGDRRPTREPTSSQHSRLPAWQDFEEALADARLLGLVA